MKPIVYKTVAEVKANLQIRGVSVNGHLKQALLEIATAAEIARPFDFKNQGANAESPLVWIFIHDIREHNHVVMLSTL